MAGCAGFWLGRVVNRRRIGCFGRRGARESLSEAGDRGRETGNLLGQPLCIGLLRSEKAPYGLQLVLNDLQLIDRFLLRDLQGVRFHDKLLGGLGVARLQLAGRRGAILLGVSAGISAPYGNRSGSDQDDDEGGGGEQDRLRA